jgi:hypothetical protein
VRQKTLGTFLARKIFLKSRRAFVGSYVGPNGRLYQRKSSKAKWIVITMAAAMTTAGLAFALRGVF